VSGAGALACCAAADDVGSVIDFLSGAASVLRYLLSVASRSHVGLTCKSTRLRLRRPGSAQQH
jgi:hypothetical protein